MVNQPPTFLFMDFGSQWEFPSMTNYPGYVQAPAAPAQPKPPAMPGPQPPKLPGIKYDESLKPGDFGYIDPKCRIQ